MLSNWPIKAEIDPHVSCSLLKETASISLDMVLSCNELGLFILQSKLTGERGAAEDGAEEEDEEMDGATVNVVLFEEVSGLSDFIGQLFSGEMKQFLSVPGEILFALLVILSSGW